MNAPTGTARRWARLALGRDEPNDDGQRRHLQVLQASLASTAGRAAEALVGLAAVPLTIGYLGAERYGAWMTLVTLLAWVDLADLGLGNSLTNAIAEARARGDTGLARRHVATALALTALLSLTLGAALAAAWPWIGWAALFNVRSPLAQAEVGRAAALSAALFLAGFPLRLVEKIYAAGQEGALGSAWVTAANLASLTALVAVTRTEGGMVPLAGAFLGARVLVQAASAAWLFGRHRPELRPQPGSLDRRSARRLLQEGGRFFLVQIAVLLFMNTDNLIIAQVLGSEAVTPYSVSWRLLSLPGFFMAMYLPYLWPAYTDALAKRDAAWIRRTFRLSIVVAAVLSVGAGVPLALFGRPIIRLWAGSAAVPPAALLAWMAAWAVIHGLMSSVACLLNAAGRVRGQMVYGLGAALVNVGLSIWWAHRFGISGVIAATVVAFLACVVIPASLEAGWLLRRAGDFGR